MEEYREMSRGKARRASNTKLSLSEIATAAEKMMMGALAHQRASVYCIDNPNAKPPSIDFLLFPAVSFELILLSIEQSIRLLLLVKYETLRPKHTVFKLYSELMYKSGRDGACRSEIFHRVNVLAHSNNIGAIPEDDVHSCLKKHDSSYASFRYFGLDSSARSSLKWGVKSYEVQILHCLALALLEINRNELQKRGVNFPGSVKEVPESEITDELKELLDRMKERSTR